jgi:OPT family oligopeptide transporter
MRHDSVELHPLPSTHDNILPTANPHTTMAPDRGFDSALPSDGAQYSSVASDDDGQPTQSNNAAKLLSDRASEPQNFTFRGVAVGLVIGVVICFSNMYFGLQTGWVSGMAMPSALLGFAYFKAVSRLLSYPFSPVENVLVQSVAGSVGTMPLGCGFVGVMPALNFLLKPEENGPLTIGLWKLIVWAVGIAFFGVVFAVPLRKQFIIREKLKFPSGTATALMIGVLHGEKGGAKIIRQDTNKVQDEEVDSAVNYHESARSPTAQMSEEEGGKDTDEFRDWKAKIRLLLISFGVSALYVRNFTSITMTQS